MGRVRQRKPTIIRTTLGKLSYWFSRWRESADPHVGVDSLLARARADAKHEDRLEWLHDLVAWLRAEVRREGPGEGASAQSVRLKYLIALLDRNPERKAAFATMLRATLAEHDAFNLLTETGLPREAGFFGELSDRLLVKLLPVPPAADLSALFVRVFPDPDDAGRLESIGEEEWNAALGVIEYGADSETGHAGYRDRLARSAMLALDSLAIQVSAGTQSSAMRIRMQSQPGEGLPAHALPYIVQRFTAAWTAKDAQRTATEYEALRREVSAALQSVEQAYTHLDARGVSIGIVYQLERLRAQLQRMGELGELLTGAGGNRSLARFFLASLVRDVHDQHSVLALVRQNFSLLSRKIVERSAETGEHYIARTRAEWADMFRRALGGGAFTAFTVYLKFFIGHFKLPAAFDAIFSSLNYSLSFLAIQFCGFTLATKQPAMTGPALAHKMHRLEDPARMGEFVDEVADLVRSQSAAIAGNLLAVAPVALALYFLLTGAAGLAPVDAEKALATMASLSIWGPAVFFAAITGVLLWLSSVIAGWVENWFFYRELGPAIGSHRRLRYVFGPSGAQKIAAFFERSIAGIAGNVSLGFLLGSVPVFFAFYGLPIEVRHVTLSTGQLATAVAALGFESMLRPGFWLAVAGIFAIGVLNLTVSFALALAVAIRARDIAATGRHAVYFAILKRLATQPTTFLFK